MGWKFENGAQEIRDYNRGYYEGRKNYDPWLRTSLYYMQGWKSGQRRLTANRSGPILHVAASQGAAYQIAMELKL
jgi:hypothetical protein